MPGQHGKAKSPREMTKGELIAQMIAYTVICGAIASGVIVTLVSNYWSRLTVWACLVPLAFIVYLYVTAARDLLGELLRRRKAGG